MSNPTKTTSKPVDPRLQRQAPKASAAKPADADPSEGSEQQPADGPEADPQDGDDGIHPLPDALVDPAKAAADAEAAKDAPKPTPGGPVAPAEVDAPPRARGPRPAPTRPPRFQPGQPPGSVPIAELVTEADPAVKVTSPRAFVILLNDRNTRAMVRRGVNTFPASLVEHPYAIANGVERV